MEDYTIYTHAGGTVGSTLVTGTVSSPAHQTEAEAEQEGEEEAGAKHQQGEGRHKVLQGVEKVSQGVLAVCRVVCQNNIIVRGQVGQSLLAQDLTGVHHVVQTTQCSVVTTLS